MDAAEDKGRAPTFKAIVDYLRKSGVITDKISTWVDGIRDGGNEANHNLEPMSDDLARRVQKFTEQLLRLAYEMPGEYESMVAQ